MSKKDPTVPDVEVFRTNVQSSETAKCIVDKLELEYSGIRANFDLEDVDNILRIESCKKLSILDIISFVNDLGFSIEVLPD